MKMAYVDFIKYPKISHLVGTLEMLDNPVEVYEKMDGGNSQIRKIKGRVISGSRSHFLGSDHSLSQPWFKGFQDWALSNYSFYKLPDNYIVYGEWLAPHTLDYKVEFVDKFFLLDVFDIDRKRFMPCSESEKVLQDLGIEDLNYLKPLISGKTNLNEIGKLLAKSSYRDGRMEGVVVKDYNSTPQKFAKLWTSTMMLDNNENDDFCEDMNRMALSLLDSGKKLSSHNLFMEAMEEFCSSKVSLSEEKIRELVDSFLEHYSP